MARKRLSDLLREEEQKDGDKSAALGATSGVAPSNASPELADSAPAEPAVAVTGEVMPPQTDLVDAGATLRDAAPAESVLDPVDSAPVTAEPTATPAERADLEGVVEQLKAELKTLQQTVQTAQTQEATLQAELDRLKVETTAQQNQIQQLQTAAAQSEQLEEQLKTELESAKQMILKLSQPATGKNSPKPMPTVMPSVRAAEPELESKPVQLVVPEGKPATEPPKRHQMALRKVLDHPIQPGALPPMPSEIIKVDKEVKLSDTDVGWMD